MGLPEVCLSPLSALSCKSLQMGDPPPLYQPEQKHQHCSLPETSMYISCGSAQTRFGLLPISKALIVMGALSAARRCFSMAV